MFQLKLATQTCAILCVCVPFVCACCTYMRARYLLLHALTLVTPPDSPTLVERNELTDIPPNTTPTPNHAPMDGAAMEALR